MSDNRRDTGMRRVARWAAIGSLAGLLSAAMAHALSIADGLEDPLRSQPPVLDRGVSLPGDSGPVPCPASVDLSQPLSLSEAVDLALCNNPQLKASWAAIKVQAGAVGEARAAYLPTVTGSVSQLHTRTQYPDFPAPDTSSNGRTVSASLNWRLFDFGGRAANREAANQLLAAALAGHDAALQKALAAVISAYFDAMTAQAVLTARSQATELARATLAATKHREVQGAAAVADTLQANTALAKALLGQRRAEGDFRKALSVLVYAMGLPAASPLRLPDTVDACQPEMINDLARWLADTQGRHPAIVAARAQWQAAEAKVLTARSEGLPTLDATGNYYQNGYPNQGLLANETNVSTVGVTLSIPIFEGLGRGYKIRGAQAQAARSEAQWQDTEHQVLTEVVKAHADAESSLGNLQSSEALLQAARESVASSERRYARGAADILELLTTQAALADAQQERIRCLAEWRSARLRLMASAGLLGRTRIGAAGAMPIGLPGQQGNTAP